MKTINDYKEELTKYLNDNRCYYDMDFDRTFLIVNIRWGDWKHDHARLIYFVNNFFKEKLGGDYEVLNTIKAEESETDCYSAEHKFVLIRKFN